MKNIGLVLCGGGAKGAYQVGVFKVLEELGLIREIKMISASSVGALNGALFLMYSAEEIQSIWYDSHWPTILGLTEQQLTRINQMIHGIQMRQIPPFLAAMNVMKIKNQMALPLQRNGLEKVLKQYLNLDLIQRSSIDLRICCQNLNRGKIEYFKFNDQSLQQMNKLLYATTAVRNFYRPVFIYSSYYCDAMGDEPLPLLPILKSDCETIIIINLNPSKRLNKKVLRGKKIIEISPSKPLGVGIYSYLDFRKPMIRQSINLGMKDARRVLEQELRIKTIIKD